MNRIRELRKKHKISMKELGQYVGVAESTISLYETEKRQPDNSVLIKIADYFNVSIDYLLGRDNIKNKPFFENIKQLKTLRKQKGLLQKDVASFLGIDRTTYVKYESVLCEPDNKTLIKLAELFSVSVDYLLGRDTLENPIPYNSFISEHEYRLLEAYRNNIDMQSAVNKLLGISDD